MVLQRAQLWFTACICWVVLFWELHNVMCASLVLSGYVYAGAHGSASQTKSQAFPRLLTRSAVVASCSVASDYCAVPVVAVTLL